MSLNDVNPGRYCASIVNWGIREVERLDGALEAWIEFDFKTETGIEKIQWKSLVLTRAGERNKKTFMTLAACGFEGDDLVKFMSPTGLAVGHEVDITIVDQPSKDGSKIYKNVEWVNPRGSAKMPGTATASGSVMDKLVRAGLGKPQKKAVVNHAPGATKGASPGQDDELPF